MRGYDHPDWLVTRPELAGLLGVSERTVNRLTDRGLSQHARGRWHVWDVARWVRGGDGAAGRTDGTPTFQQGQIELAKARASKLRAQTARLRSEVIPSEHVHHAMRAMEGILSTGLDRLPPAAGTALAERNTPAEVEDELEELVRVLRTGLADELEALATGWCCDDTSEAAQ